LFGSRRFGLVALAYVVIRLATQSFDWELGVQKLALPVWLTLGALPLLAFGSVARMFHAARRRDRPL
jgi:hypothetical protein